MQMTLLRGGCDYDYYDNIYTAATAERERGTERAKPLCVPLPILNIYAYKAGILSYIIDRSIELRFKLQRWARQLNLLVRILLRTSFPLFYVNRHTSPPHIVHISYIISDSGSPSSRRTSRLTLTLIENMKCDISQHRQTQHTLCIRHTWRILISPMLPTYAFPGSLSPLPPNTISARSETELSPSISCRFHAEKITKVFAAILHTHTHTRAHRRVFLRFSANLLLFKYLHYQYQRMRERE